MSNWEPSLIVHPERLARLARSTGPGTAIAAVVWTAVALSAAAPAAAQTYRINLAAARPTLGEVISAASGETVFRIDASSGAASVISGGGARLGRGARRALATVSCDDDRECDTDRVAVEIDPLGAVTGRAAAIRGFAVSMGSAVLASPPVGASSLRFVIAPVGRNRSRTFYLGADIPIEGDDSAPPSGAASAMFQVSVGPAEDGHQGPTASALGTATGRVIQPLSITKTSDLAFGRVVRPSQGFGELRLDAATGQRSLTAGVGLPRPSAVPARFAVSGQGGRMISVGLPSRFGISAGSRQLSVTTNTTGKGSVQLSTSGGRGGYEFAVGGTIRLRSSTPPGVYRGILTVTAAYD